MAERQNQLCDDNKHGSMIMVKIIPRASKNIFVELLDDGRVKIRLTAPPVDGKANQALIDFLSEQLDLPEKEIKIVSGQASHNKLISIGGISSEKIIARIQKCIKNLDQK